MRNPERALRGFRNGSADPRTQQGEASSRLASLSSLRCLYPRDTGPREGCRKGKRRSQSPPHSRRPTAQRPLWRRPPPCADVAAEGPVAFALPGHWSVVTLYPAALPAPRRSAQWCRYLIVESHRGGSSNRMTRKIESSDGSLPGRSPPGSTIMRRNYRRGYRFGTGFPPGPADVQAAGAPA